MRTCKNYKTDGGNKWVVNGTLEIGTGASVTGITTATIADNLTTNDAGKALSAKQGVAIKTLIDGKIATTAIADNLTTDDAAKVLSAKQGVAIKTLIDSKVAENQADSTADSTAGIVTDFNALLAKLKAAGLMEADAEGGE